MCWLCKVCISWFNSLLQLYIQFILNLVWGTDHIFWVYIYMFILTKLTYILYIIIISSFCILWGFVKSFDVLPGSSRLGLCGCYPILLHGSINSISLNFDSRHFKGCCFIILLVNFWYDSWCLPVFIDIDYFYVAGILLQVIFNFEYLIFFHR